MSATITFERREAAFPCYRVMRDGVLVAYVERPTAKYGWCVAPVVDGIETPDHEIWWCGSFAAAKRGARARWGAP